MVKAVIFDFDGLLFDSEPIWDRAYFEFIKIKNLRDVDLGETTGMGLREFIELLQEHGLEGVTSELVSEYRGIFYKLFDAEKDVLMPGVMEILEKVSTQKMVIALTSGGHTGGRLKEMLGKYGILNFFSVVVSSDEVKRGKPAPDVYLEALSELKLEADECLALEDSVNGVLAAKAAGLSVYGVNAKGGMRNGLIKAKADRVYKSLLEVKL